MNHACVCKICPRAILAALLLAAALFGSVSRASADDFTLPGGPPYISRLKLDVEDLGIDANGYRPLRLTLSAMPKKPLTADRQVRVVLAISRYGSKKVAQVSQVIEIPEGSASASASLLVPQFGGLSNVGIEVFEGGQRLDDLSSENTTSSGRGWDWTEARPALLFIDSDVPPRSQRPTNRQNPKVNSNTDSSTFGLPDLRTIIEIFPDTQTARPNPGGPPTQPKPKNLGPPPSDRELLTMLAPFARLRLLPPSELPERWIELSQYDVAFISLDNLSELSKRRPKQLAALRDWLSTGTLLITYGAGSDFAHLPEVEDLLSLRPLPPSDSPTEFRGWQAPVLSARTGKLRTPFDDGYDAVIAAADDPKDATEFDEVADEIKKMADLAKSGRYSPPFVLRDAALGRVVAISVDDPFPGNVGEWTWIFNTAGENHWQWFRRNGFSLSRHNPDYWKLLIPGVGQAPVFSYLVLVSLFAILIGPVNFLVLSRARRLYLLLITVPLGALVVTGCLMAFALLVDGLGIRMRGRSYTELDQTTGRATSWSRQSYYAALSPSRGLQFPDDTTVFPIFNLPGSQSSEKNTLLHWDGDQTLRSGHLASRTASQFMVCRATPCKLKLTVHQRAAAPPTVENQLDAQIQYLLLCDEEGQLSFGQALRRNASAQLQPIEATQAQSTMRHLANLVAPAVPKGFDLDAANDNIFSLFGSYRYRYGYYDSGSGDPLMQAGLLESNLEKALRPGFTPPPPRTYVAIVETSPLVITGLGPLREEASLHVIRGNY